MTAKNIPFKQETWERDADGDLPDLCTDCGRPVRYGSRHGYCVTPWFSGTVKPARPGVYQRTDHDQMRDFACWDGRRWMCGQRTPEKAGTLVMMESLFQPHHGDYRFSWRGLAKDPK